MVTHKYRIRDRKDLIEKTAIRNCHALGLHSFIINENPKMRLFIADPDSELSNVYNPEEPIIPIHSHKYNDLFSVLYGTLHQHLYTLSHDEIIMPFPINSYNLIRISDSKKELANLGRVNLTHLDTKSYKTEHFLKAEELHSVSTTPDKNGKCAWLITETIANVHYTQVAYHQNLIKRNNLYLPFENAHDYLMKYFEIS